MGEQAMLRNRTEIADGRDLVIYLERCHFPMASFLKPNMGGLSFGIHKSETKPHRVWSGRIVSTACAVTYRFSKSCYH
jgi:hypothetical protein